jgi:hypothetical protein
MPEDTEVPEEDAVFLPPAVEPPSEQFLIVEPSSEDENPGPDEEEVKLPEFDPRYREIFEGLLFIGKVSKQFTWFGHKIIMRTPTVDDLLEIGLLHKPWVGTVAEVKAYQALVIAATIQSIDGQPFPPPLHSDDNALEAKFNYVKKYYPWTFDKLYNEYLTLDAEVAAAHDALGKA